MDCVYQPTKIPAFEGLKIKQISAWSQSAAVSINDEAFVWGLSVAGDHSTPQLVELPNPVEQVECGGRLVTFRTNEGAVYAFGADYYKETRIGDTHLTRKTPKRVLASKVQGMSVGGNYAIAFRSWADDDAPFSIDPEAYAVIKEDNRSASPDHRQATLTQELATLEEEAQAYKSAVSFR